MRFTRKKMLEVLNNAKDAFENALKNESMIVQTSAYGFTRERLEKALDIYKKADEYFRDKGSRSGYKLSINYQVSKKLVGIKKIYRSFRRILKRAFKRNPDILSELQLNVPLPRLNLGWIKRIKEFYGVCEKKEHLKSLVSQYGLSEDRIATELKNVTEVETGYLEKSLAKMGSEKATQDRNKILQDLFDEFYIFKEILMAIYGETDPHFLEGYGIRVYDVGFFRRISKKKKPAVTTNDGDDNNGSGVDNTAVESVKELPAIKSTALPGNQ